MLFNTHIRIGNHLFASLPDPQASFISKQAFVYGNIKPDLIRKGPLDRHIYSVSKNYLAQLFHQLMADDLENLTKTECIVQLGVLCHHISDLFCRYHHDPVLYPNLRCHFLYEVGLHRRFLRMVETGFLLNVNNPLLRRADEMMEFLSIQIEAYSREEPSFDLDIRYAVHNCTQIMETLVPHIIAAFTQEPAPLPEPEFLLWRDAI